MKRRVTLILLCAVFMLSACSTQSKNDKTDSSNVSEKTEDVSAEENKSTDDKDMEKLASMIQTTEEMMNFLHQGIEMADDFDLRMEMTDYWSCGEIMRAVYNNFTLYDDGFTDEMDDTEYEIFTITKLSKNERIYNFNNIAYDYEQRDIEDVITDTTYYAEKNLLENITTLRQPESKSIDKYLVDEEGRLYIVGAQLFMDTLYIDVLYYDGSFIGIARTHYENQSEIRIPYDLFVQTPAGFEDMLTEDSYITYFTYDGTDYEYKGY